MCVIVLCVMVDLCVSWCVLGGCVSLLYCVSDSHGWFVCDMVCTCCPVCVIVVVCRCVVCHCVLWLACVCHGLYLLSCVCHGV